MKNALLDTNVLLGWMRETPETIAALAELRERSDIAKLATSVICKGEIWALAKSNGWGAAKRTRLRHLLASLPTFSINAPAVSDAYSSIQTWTRGKSVEAPGGEPPLKPGITMGQNDLWIAATAHARNAPLVSADAAFLRLDGVWIELIQAPVLHPKRR